MFTQLSQIEGAALSTWGNGDTWQKNLVNVLRIFELFRSPAMVLLLTVPWIELPFETLASAHMYDFFTKSTTTFCCITSLKPASTLAKRCLVMSLPITFARSSTWPRGSLWATPHTRAWGRHSGFSRAWMGGPLCMPSGCRN